MNKRVKSIGGALICAMFLVGLIGCGSAKEDYAEDRYSNNMDMVTEDMDSTYGGNADALVVAETTAKSANFTVGGIGKEPIVNQERKVILNEFFSIESTDFEEDKASILSKMKELGGYIEQSESYGNGINEKRSRKNARLVIRIPKENYDEFVSGMIEGYHVVSQTSNSSDVTHQFYDTEARVKTLKIQEERLLEILKKSGEIKDIIEIEKELQSVRYQIESNTTTLKRLDNLVSYTTITIQLNEVHKVTEIVVEPESLGDKIARAFKNSIEQVNEILKGFLIGLIGSVPYLIIYVPIIIILLIAYRRIKKNGRKHENHVNAKKENSENNKE